ncbi:hypothetical protein [Lysobacter sp. A289]
MLIRALVVLLVVLNLGVALWWALRVPAPADAPAIADGVARLQLVTETRADPAIVPAASSTPAEQVQAEPSQCFRFGPFADAAAARQAQLRLQPQLLRASIRSLSAGTPRSWQVLLPPLPSRDEAQDTAKRVLAAGFKDYYVIGDGGQANAISLGLFGGESSARQHAASLAAAGFPARVIPIGAGPAEHWLDAGAGEEFDPADAQASINGSRAKPIDCEVFDADLPAVSSATDQPTPPPR